MSTKPKFIKIERWMIGKFKSKAAIFILSWFAQWDGKSCRPSLEYIASVLRESVSGVHKAIMELKKAGYLEILKTGKHKTSNEYIITGKVIEEREAWTARNAMERLPLPPFLIVYIWMIQGFKASIPCLLYANLFAMDAASKKKKPDSEEYACRYDHNYFAKICGCTPRSIQSALQMLESVQAISKAQNRWKGKKKSRYEYQITPKFEFSTYMRKIYVQINTENDEPEKSGNSKCRNRKKVEIQNSADRKKVEIQTGVNRKKVVINREYSKRRFFSPNRQALHCLIEKSFPAAHAQAETAEPLSGGKRPCKGAAFEISILDAAPPVTTPQPFKTDQELAMERADRDSRNERTLAAWGQEIEQEKKS